MLAHPTYLVIFALGASAIAACGEPESAASVNAKSVTAATLDDKFDIGGYALHMKCVGTGEPTVLIDAGMGEPPIESGSWSKVVDQVSGTMRTCIYDRAGLGTSEPARHLPRTSQDIVLDLKKLVTQARIDGPLILVGHSIGGMNLILYSKLYPENIRGIVLVDSSHPDQWGNWLDILPPQSPTEPSSIAEARKFLQRSISDPNSNSERIDLALSAKQAKAVGSLGSIPIVVLTHSPKWKMVPDLPDHILEKLEAETQSLQKDLLKLSSHSSQRVSDSAGHYIQTDDPALVVSAIDSLR
jgi:pimeloyl-ACP methyl ester carboxylesterase